MKRFCGLTYCLFIVNIFLCSCMAPHDPSAYADDEAVLHDSEKIIQFVKKDDSANHEVSETSFSGYEGHVFAVEDQSGGFGYNILKDGRLFIHQSSIPSLQGNKTFSSHSKAMKAAEFVIYKLEMGMVPPSVTEKELDSLGALN